MTRLLRSFAATFFLAALVWAALAPAPASAAQVMWCRSAPAVGTAGPGRWTAPSSGTTYSLNNAGCALISPADVGDAIAGGFNIRSQIFSLVANALTAAGTVVLPAGTYIDRVIIQETSGSTITGGVIIGTASGGTQVMLATNCTTSCLVWVPDASLSTRIFSSTTPQTLFIDAGSSWHSGRINLTVMYGYF